MYRERLQHQLRGNAADDHEEEGAAQVGSTAADADTDVDGAAGGGAPEERESEGAPEDHERPGSSASPRLSAATLITDLASLAALSRTQSVLPALLAHRAVDAAGVGRSPAQPYDAPAPDELPASLPARRPRVSALGAAATAATVSRLGADEGHAQRVLLATLGTHPAPHVFTMGARRTETK
jgi:hypothetical protein